MTSMLYTFNASGINKPAFKWACTFSSYIACISVALAVGAACWYLFQTAVENMEAKCFFK